MGDRTFRRVGTVLSYQLDTDHEWTTSGGDVLVGRAGDWLVSNDSDMWTVAADVFERTYEQLPNGRWRKTALITAVRATERTTIQTLEGPAVAEVGDWIATNPTGESWPIKADTFARHYVPAD